jgi:tetratricopeptide (TPR) repeat protein
MKGNAVHDWWYSRRFTHFVQPPVANVELSCQIFTQMRRGMTDLRRADRRRSATTAHRRAPQSAARLTRLALISVMAVTGFLAAQPAYCAAAASSPLPPVSDATSYAAQANSAKAHELVAAAINMTDSERAVKLLWQATEIDPALDEPYMYLALYYDSRSQFDKVVEVYQKLLKYQPKEATAYINIGEAYMSFSPPRFDSALPYYLKALQLEPGNSFAALRVGEVYAQKGDAYRGAALRYLNLARSDRSKNPTTAAEADKVLHEMGAS